MGKIIRSLLLATIIIVISITITGCASAEKEGDVEKESKVETFVKGLDISQHQGDIDVNAVPNDIELVVIRVGRSTYGSWSLGVDTAFLENIEKFSEKGTKIALYWYSTAITEEEAVEEAYYMSDTIKGLNADVRNNISYLFIDRESSEDNGRADYINGSLLTDVLIAQIGTLKSQLPSVKIGLYTNIDWFKKLDIKRLGDVPYWVAWTGGTEFSNFDQVLDKVENLCSPEHAEYLKKNIVMWQYSFEGEVPGITENKVDLNIVSSKMFN